MSSLVAASRTHLPRRLLSIPLGHAESFHESKPIVHIAWYQILSLLEGGTDLLPLECRREFLGIETKGTGFGLEPDSARFIDEIETVGPARVFLLHMIVYGIDQGGDRDMQFAHTRIGNRLSIFFRGRIGKQNALFDIALHLPNVCGMSLVDINNEKRDAIFILFIPRVERGNRPAKRWSSITAKDENDRFLGLK